MFTARLCDSLSLAIGFCLLVVIISSGCSTVGISTTLLASGNVEPPEATPAATYTVEIHSKNGRSQRAEIPLTEPTSVDGALRKVNAHKKFKRMNISVARKVKGQYEPFKMKSYYDPAKRQVTVATDYALHPGDRIIITEDSTSLLDEMVSSLLGPIGR